MTELQCKASVKLYTDGACEPNPGPGGWAFVLKHLESGKRMEDSGGEVDTTNNRMELMAAIKGLERLKFPCEVELYSDSQYLVMGLLQWMDEWIATGRLSKKVSSVKNPDLWWRLDVLRKMHKIKPIKVKGHSGYSREQEVCDRLAYAAIRKMYKRTNPGLKPPVF